MALPTEITCATFPEAAAAIAELLPAVLAREIAIYAIRRTGADILSDIVCEETSHFTLNELAAFGTTPADARASYALHYACVGGHLQVAQWLAATCDFTPAEVSGRGNYTLHCTCGFGRLDVAKWLVATFGISDIREDALWALRYAGMKGHLAVVQWLVATFDLSATDIRSDDNSALRSAGANGHLPVVEWLADTFGLTASDMRAGDNYILRRVYSNRGVAQWMKERFGIMEAELEWRR